MSDLDTIDYGLVLDLSIELGNDFDSANGANNGGEVRKATQADMDLFARG